MPFYKQLIFKEIVFCTAVAVVTVMLFHALDADHSHPHFFGSEVQAMHHSEDKKFLLIALLGLLCVNAIALISHTALLSLKVQSGYNRVKPAYILKLFDYSIWFLAGGTIHKKLYLDLELT